MKITGQLSFVNRLEHLVVTLRLFFFWFLSPQAAIFVSASLVDQNQRLRPRQTDRHALICAGKRKRKKNAIHVHRVPHTWPHVKGQCAPLFRLSPSLFPLFPLNFRYSTQKKNLLNINKFKKKKRFSKATSLAARI